MTAPGPDSVISTDDLSYGEQALWVAHQLAPHSAAYNVALGLRINAELNVEVVRQCVQAAVDRHPMLRATYATRNDKPVRHTHAHVELPFEHVDASGWSMDELSRSIDAAAARPFDLVRGPAIRVALFSLGRTDHVLLLASHHIVLDMWSTFRLIVPEIRAYYAATLSGTSPTLADPGSAYDDFAAWQARILKEPTGAKQREYWHAQLAAPLPTLDFLSDRPRPPRKQFEGASVPFALEPDVVQALRRLAREEHTSPYTVLFSAFQVLLQRYTGQQDLLIGVPLAGRTERQFRRTVGYFVNPLAVRATLDGDPRFDELVARVHERVRGAARHQDYPLSRLVDELQPRRDVSRSPLYDVMFNCMPAPHLTDADDSNGQLPMSVYPVRQQEGQVDLSLDLVDSESRIDAMLRYSTDLFDAATVERMASLYQTILKTATSTPRSRLSELPQIATEERTRLRHWDSPAPERSDASGAPRPSTPLAELLSGIFCEVLGVDQVQPDDDFFALAGNSLHATQVVARIKSALGLELAVPCIFEHASVGKLELHVQQCLREYPALAPDGAIERVSRDGPLPLSFAQERMWFLHAAQPDGSAYNVVAGVRVKGPLDAELLRHALNALVQRHETLRTSIVVTEDGPAQIIAPSLRADLPLIDLGRFGPEEAECELREQASDLAATPFDLSCAPLMRCGLFRLAPDHHVVVVSLHHTVTDAWSLNVLTRELAELYQGLVEQRAPRLPRLSVQFADFAHWQRRHLRADLLTEQLTYWRSYLDGLKPLQLPTDRPRPAVESHRGAHLTFEYPGLLDRVRVWSRGNNATPFMAWLTAFVSVLHRYTSQTDVAVGMPIANRRWLDSERLIGPLTNTLVVRADLSEDPTARELLEQVRAHALKAYTHQDIPFDTLVAELQPERTADRAPVFQVMFDYINTPGELELPGLTWSAEHVDRRASQFDLSLVVVDTPQVKRIGIEFNTDLFDATTIERLMAHLHQLLESMLADPDQRIAELQMLTIEEQQELLHDWNATAREFPREARVEELFSAQAAVSPDAIAVEGIDGHLSYAQLERASNRLANYLREQGIGRGHLVALHLERTTLLAVALLGILKSGAAYLPIDPAYPRERQRFVIEDSGARMLLTQRVILSGSSLLECDVPVICLDDEAQARAIAASSERSPVRIGRASDPMYVIYTSGSTGQPKGVEVGHRSVVNFLHSMREEPGLTAADVLVAVTTVSFDIAVLELFLPLMVGACLVIAGREVVADSLALAELLRTRTATCMQATPVLWRLLMDANWRPNASFKAICGGEPLPADLASKLLARGVTLWNAYGPTETTVWSTLHHVTEGQDPAQRVSIGRPIANTRIVVRDAHGQLVPAGVWGELFIGGDGLAHGYLHRPELTRERFVEDSFADQPGARLYRTGDIARWLADGSLDVLGRSDQQVKIRGHRIELGEIEALLRGHPAVRDVCVALRQAYGEACLVGYVVTVGATRSDALAWELRSFLRQQVPEFMVPGSFVWLETLPRTPNGKLDRAQLPAPDSSSETARRVVHPRDAFEATLVEQWQECLGVTPIGVHDNFFDLGGHSLLAIRLIYRLRERYGWHIPMATFLRGSTIAELATVLRATPACDRWRPLVEIQVAASAPLFLVHGVFGDMMAFDELIGALGPDQTIYGLRAHGLDGIQEPLTSIEEMAAAYIEEMRSVQPHGPYRLVGWSAGGSIAYEIACQLQECGESVGLLAILDHSPAGGAVIPRPSLGVAVRRSMRYAWRNLPHWGSVWIGSNATEKRQLALSRVRVAIRQLGRARRTGAEDVVRDIEATHGLGYIREWPEFRRHLLGTQVEAMRTYRPRPSAGPLLLFRCMRQPVLSSHEPTLGWQRYALGGVEVVHVPGNHGQLLRDANARFVGLMLLNKLDEVCGRTSALLAS